MTCGCNRRSYTADIERADSLTEASCPVEALAILEDIPARKLRRDDRALHALVTVKTHDKLNHHHTSDSAIRIATSYFHSHGSAFRQAEAAFYNGRVLSDLQNHAAALDAYDDALNLLPTSDTIPFHLRLRSLINSLTAQLLTDLYLYQEAIPFYNTAIDISIALGDSANAVIDLRDLVYTYIHVDSLKLAETHLDEAYALATNLRTDLRYKLDLLHRELLFAQGGIKESYEAIDTLIPLLDTSTTYGKMFAAKAFHKANLRDSALYYANQITDAGRGYPTIAYSIIAAQHLTNDSLAETAFNNYRSSIDSRFRTKTRETQLILHNYIRAHKAELEADRISNENRLLNILLIIIISAIALIATVLRLYVHYKIRINRLAYLSDLQYLQKRIEHRRVPISAKQLLLLPQESTSTLSNSKLRKNLVTNIQDIYKNHRPLHPDLVNSEICTTLRGLIEQNKCIPQTSENEIWTKLRTTISTHNPNFFTNLTLLLGKYHRTQFQIAMLIYLGFTSQEISILTARELNSLSYHRKKISIALGIKLKPKDLECAIRNL